MKRTFLLTTIVSIMMIAALPSNVSAVDISAGATTWYTWWDINQSGNDSSEFDPAFLYGPALSVKFNDEYNLSFVFLYGTFDMLESSSSIEMTRTDGDLALNYRLNNYLKIFAGVKYMSYDMTGMNHWGIGPGAGMSAVIHVAGNFYILGNVSGLYIWGKEENDDSPDADYNEYGMNSSISLAYYIVPASTTLSLGGRYQYFKTLYDKSTNNDMAHHFYGVTLSANYSFEL